MVKSKKKIQKNLEKIFKKSSTGRCLLPATSYLHMVRETLVLMTPGQYFNGMNIEFENVKFLRATSLTPNTPVNLTIVIHCGSGAFEISEGKTAIVTGTIRSVKEKIPMTEISEQHNGNCPKLTKDDFYKELRLRGYNYAGIFQSVAEANGDGTCGKIAWIDNNWPAFMDCLLQVNILSIDSRSLYLPTSIRKICINTEAHLEAIASADAENPTLAVRMSKDLNTVVCGGIEITGMTVNSVSRRKPPGTEVLESYRFVPYNCDNETFNRSDALGIFLQIGQENMPQLRTRIVEIDSMKEPLIPAFEEALNKTPLVVADLVLLTQRKPEEFENVHAENGELDKQKNCHYIVAANTHTDEEFLKLAFAALEESGFLILQNQEKLPWNTMRTSNGFQLISQLKSTNEWLTLWQKVSGTPKSNEKSIRISSLDETFSWIEPLRDALHSDANTVAVIEQEPFSGVLGLVKCIRREPNGNRLKCIRIDDLKAPTFSIENPIYHEQLQLNLAMNVLSNGKWGTYRHIQLPQIDTEQICTDHFFLNMKRLGDLSSFAWMSGWLDTKRNRNLIRVQYSAINFRDVMLATGRLPPEMHSTDRLKQQCLLGLEYSGVAANGDNIMGMVGTGAMGTHVEPVQYLTWKVPANICLRDAATIPAVYTTIYYAFFFYRPIEAEKSILIHAGSGGIGLSAIRVALAYGMHVFTTVSTPRKRQYLLELFPKLKPENIGNSRDCSFEQMILKQTNGKGVDYVLNSLAEEKLAASVRCLGRGGTFLEIGKFDIINNSALAMETFSREITFRAVFADNLIYMPKEREIVWNMIVKDLNIGIIQPLHSTVFPATEAEKAFRFLSTGKHIGKVLIQVRTDPMEEKTLPMTISPKITCDPKMVYIILGGLGGFGLELADWLVVRGARILVLSSRRGVTSAYQAYRIK